jgi:hypothetical protein
MLCEDSLAATLDAVNDALFQGVKIPQRNRTAVAKWLAGRCGQPGSYEFMPAPTALDFSTAPRLFTGEPLTTRAGMACKLGNEGCRALIQLDVQTPVVATALQLAEERMAARLDDVGAPRAGYYCCGSCTVAYWRHLLAGGLDHQEQRLASGVQHLQRARLGTGRWRFFPFWYSTWTLLDLDLPEAREELQYAAPVLERVLDKGVAPRDVYAARRSEIAQRALALI